MKILSHFPAIGVSNTYLIGPDNGGDAVLVDPGQFDVELLNLIEDNGFYIKAVLATHDHGNHVQGLKTLLKIYNADIFAGSDHVLGFPSTTVNDGEIFRAAGFDVEVQYVIGHSFDSRIYKVGTVLFTGDIISAGRCGTTLTTHNREFMLEAIKEKIFPYDDEILIFPGHGPPTSVGIEKKWNPEIGSRTNRPEY